ncbi:uncharacterized protein LOC6540853 isoform X3 [Drosophila erecta]|uniref:uncharacterized protein LOC6540853 isoform X3 n=1 Tax=Drosophila erecta TaxID=7220 RepID=UPI000F06C444|nr:uncharacterized protein LOC6540853 isoform X3 [Drosophila erecta]
MDSPKGETGFLDKVSLYATGGLYLALPGVVSQISSALLLCDASIHGIHCVSVYVFLRLERLEKTLAFQLLCTASEHSDRIL